MAVRAAALPLRGNHITDWPIGYVADTLTAPESIGLRCSDQGRRMKADGFGVPVGCGQPGVRDAVTTDT